MCLSAYVKRAIAMHLMTDNLLTFLLTYVGTLPCEIFVFTNRHDQEQNEASRRARQPPKT